MKIATAITKFITPLTTYQTQGIISKSFIINVNKYKTAPLTRKLVSQKSKKNNGRERILNTGRIVVLITQRIIPQIAYVFKASREVYPQSSHQSIIPACIDPLAFSQSKYVIA